MIERIYVHNFRSLENFTLDLSGHASALVIGKNGSGKSTVLKSLELFQSICRGAGRVGDLISPRDFAQHQTDAPMRFEVELTLSDKRYKYEIAFEWPANFREARILDESLSLDGNVVFSRHHAQIQLSGGQPWGLDWHVFALPVIHEPPGERAIQDVRAFFSTMILIAPIPANMTGFSEEPTMELAHDASNFGSCLRALLSQKPAAYSVFDSQLKAMIPDFSSIENIERGENGTQLIVNFEHPDTSRTLSVEFKGLSDGEKCFFLGAYIISYNTTRASAFCMWDEPDNHLSLSEVGHFIIGLRKAAHRGGQFLATSHHPETVRKFSDETTFVLTRKSHLEPTLVRPLVDLGYSGDLVHALIRDEIIS